MVIVFYCALGGFVSKMKLVPLFLKAVQPEQQLDCALDLMRRLPPQKIVKNLSDLIDLVPNLCEDLLSSVDQPLKIARDEAVGKDYLLCDYNRDGDSYRWVCLLTSEFRPNCGRKTTIPSMRL